MKKNESIIYKVIKFCAATLLIVIGCNVSARAADEFLVYKYTHTYTQYEYGPGERHVEKRSDEDFLIWNLRSNEYAIINLSEDRQFATGNSSVWHWSEVIIDQHGKKHSVLSFRGAPDVIQQDWLAITDTMSAPLTLRAIESGPQPKKLEVAKVYRGSGQMENAVPDVRWRSWTVSTNHMLLADRYTQRVNDEKPGSVREARELMMQFLEAEGWEFRDTTGRGRK